VIYFYIVTVRFNTTLVRDDESAGSLTFILVTNRPADESFTVQVFTQDIDPDAFELATGNMLDIQYIVIRILYYTIWYRDHRVFIIQNM